jgi:Tol biopolymer transport system component
VLFASTAQNLVAAASNAPTSSPHPVWFNVFLRDRTNGTTTLVSVNLAGTGGNGYSLPVTLSTNGQYALFVSSASDLVPADTNNATDVFVRDLLNGNTLLVSASTNGGVADGASRNPAMTPDGRYVAFVSAADNLVIGDTNGIPDVFVRDLVLGTNILVSVGAVTSNATYYLQPSSSEAPDITPDGRYVVFQSGAAGLVPGSRRWERST